MMSEWSVGKQIRFLSITLSSSHCEIGFVPDEAISQDMEEIATGSAAADAMTYSQ
jgi:hypothetical protein